VIKNLIAKIRQFSEQEAQIKAAKYCMAEAVILYSLKQPEALHY
jgi:hypothetical protein